MSTYKLCSCKNSVHGEGGCANHTASHKKDRLCTLCSVIHREK